MNIIQTFLDLTKKTYPHGTEHLLEPFLPENIQKDKFGNYFHVVGDGNSRVIFASHLDTVSANYDDVIHTFDEEGRIVGTDGSTTLGADDKAGVTIMLYMIEKQIPGLYYFFIGEEVGCIGSGKVSRENHIFNKDNYDKVISFDRRGNTSVITHQSLLRCCSDSFANELVNQLNEQGLGMETDDTGVCTDSLEFAEDIPECTNLSVGYMDEHTGNETQDLEFLENMCKACVEVNWEDLPTERDPSVSEYKTKRYNRNWNSWNRRNSWNRQSNSHTCSYPRRNTDFDDDFDEIERQRLALVCGYHELDDNDDYEFDEDNPWLGHGLNDNRNTIPYSNAFDDVDDESMCYSHNSLFQHRNAFFDNLDNPMDSLDDIKERENFFESIKDKYMDDRLSDEEILTIKEQLLDMDDPIDASFAEDIDSLINLKNWNNYAYGE